MCGACVSVSEQMYIVCSNAVSVSESVCMCTNVATIADYKLIDNQMIKV